jgi:hypothetical protein
MEIIPMQEHIEQENNKLEQNGDGSWFSTEEIAVRMEYKSCPNLTIIDTPGMWGVQGLSITVVVRAQLTSRALNVVRTSLIATIDS